MTPFGQNMHCCYTQPQSRASDTGALAAAEYGWLRSCADTLPPHVSGLELYGSFRVYQCGVLHLDRWLAVFYLSFSFFARLLRLEFRRPLHPNPKAKVVG